MTKGDGRLGTKWERWAASGRQKYSRALRAGQNGGRKPETPRAPSLVPAQVAVMPQAPIIDLDAPRTLTAEFCGDPLPGRSALDRRGGRV